MTVKITSQEHYAGTEVKVENNNNGKSATIFHGRSGVYDVSGTTSRETYTGYDEKKASDLTRRLLEDD